MTFDKYHVVLLKKGPTWTPESTPELDKLQEDHLAHLRELHQAGQMSIAGPVQDFSAEGDIRGISVFPETAVSTIEEVKALVEADPMFTNGRLVAEYMTWHVPEASKLQH